MRLISKTPVVSLTAYSAGDVIGTKLALGAHNGRIESFSIIDASNQGPAGSILFFDGDPAAATITDNAAFVPSTDLGKLIGVVAIPAYVTVGSKKIATALNVALGVRTEKLTAVIVTSGTPTLVATNDITVKVAIKPDLK